MTVFLQHIKKRIQPEYLFFAAFISRLIIATFNSTMFPSIGIARKLALLIVLSCCAIKIVFYDTYNLSEILSITAVGFCMALNMVKTSRNVMLILYLLVVASKGVDFKKILKVYLVVVGSIVAFTFMASLGGVVENLRYWVSEEHYFRNSFGIVYCTDFAARIFFLMLSYFYLRGEKLRWFEYILAILLTVFVYLSTRGKLDTSCMIITIVVFLAGNIITKEKGIKQVLKARWNGLWRAFAPIFIFFAAAFMIIITYMFNNEVEWMVNLDEFITKRLSVAHNTWIDHGFGLFGQKLDLIGNGLTTITPEHGEYNFIDCSYVNLLVTSGLMILLIFLLTYSYASFKNKSDIYLMYAVVIISINAMIAHHFFDMSYNPFTFMIMASVVPVIKEREEYVGKKVQCYINF